MVAFYLRSQSKGAQQIYVRITVRRGQQYRFSTGWQLPDNAKWDVRLGRIKKSRNNATQALNAELARLRSWVERKEIWALANEATIDKAFYKGVLAEFRGEREPSGENDRWTLEEAFKRFIAYNESPDLPGSERKMAGTIKTYKTCLSFLESTNHGSDLLEAIDMDWYRSFVTRAERGGRAKEGLSRNYIGKLIKLIKRVLRFSEESGQEVNQAYRRRDFKVLTEEVASIYLTKKEIDVFRSMDLRTSPTLCDTRDLFVVGCYTGLRYSDFSKLSETDIKEHEGVRMFEVRSQKTGARVSIPVHPVVEDIIHSRNGHLPSYQSDQLMNRNLKKLGEMAGLHEAVEIERTEGGVRRAQKKLKYELIQTHTARRSFCTNAYLQGLDTLDIMAISGHTTEKSFLRYIKVTREQRAKRIAAHPFFQA